MARAEVRLPVHVVAQDDHLQQVALVGIELGVVERGLGEEEAVIRTKADRSLVEPRLVKEPPNDVLRAQRIAVHDLRIDDDGAAQVVLGRDRGDESRPRLVRLPPAPAVIAERGPRARPRRGRVPERLARRPQEGLLAGAIEQVAEPMQDQDAARVLVEAVGEDDEVAPGRSDGVRRRLHGDLAFGAPLQLAAAGAKTARSASSATRAGARISRHTLRLPTWFSQPAWLHGTHGGGPCRTTTLPAAWRSARSA